MLRTRVLPCLLLYRDALVKSIRFKDINYIGDAINTVRIFNQMEVDEIILLDIGTCRDNLPPNFHFIEQIAGECFMPVTYGGGIRSLDDIRVLLSIGVEKVSVNTAARDIIFVQRTAETFGSQSIIVSMDVKKGLFGRYEIRTHGGKQRMDTDPVKFAKQLETAGAGEILLTSIDRDGTWKGYDLELIRMVSQSVHIPVIANGGARDVPNLLDAVETGRASAVAAGSLFIYQGPGLGVLINYPSESELQQTLGEYRSIDDDYQRISYVHTQSA